MYDCEENLWQETFINGNRYLDDCVEMYERKTKERVKKLIDSELDKVKIINGVEVEPIKDMLDKVDWMNFYQHAIPSYFHGDLQPENIIYDERNDKFVLIDWRQKFGNSIQIGDVYYDV